MLSIAENASQEVLATTDNKEVMVYRGPSENVLKRYNDCAVEAVDGEIQSGGLNLVKSGL